MFLSVHVSVYTCMWRPEVDVGHLPLSLSTCLWRQGLSLTLELMNLDRLAGHCANTLSSVSELQMHTPLCSAFTWMLQIADAGLTSTLPNELSPAPKSENLNEENNGNFLIYFCTCFQSLMSKAES